MKTNDGRIIGRVNEHNCIMEPDRIQALRVRANMREGAETIRERPINIIIDGVYGQNNSVLARLPAPASMARTIRRQRQRVNINELIPDQYDVLFNIPDQYRTTSTEELFLQYDLQINGQRLLIFESAEGVNFVSEAPHWFVDGTFETVPPQFAQLYTFHGLCNGRNVVCLFALLMDKSEATYDNLFSHVRILTRNANPVSINMDY